MDDNEIVSIARKIDALNGSINSLVKKIEQSDHPNAKKIAKLIFDDLGLPSPSFVPVEIHDLLESPHHWIETREGTDLILHPDHYKRMKKSWHKKPSEPNPNSD